MWLFTTKGYVSIVAHRDDKDLLLVRARVRSDLEDFLGAGTKHVIEETPDADYRWRAIIPRGDVGLLIGAYVYRDLTYDNFKDAVEGRDSTLDDILADLWHSLRRWQQDSVEHNRRPMLRGTMPVCKPCKNKSQRRSK
jgi:hypothetical protein